MPAPTTFSALLDRELRSDPSGPLVTFYDHDTGERVELSRATYANWVAKAAGLLADEHDLARGDRLLVDLPPHWLGTVFVGAAWTLGLVLCEADETDPDAVVCGPDSLDRWAPEATRRPTLACSLRPLGVRFADPLPHGVHDVGVEIWGQPDAFVAFDPPGPSDPATDALSQADLVATAAAGSLLTDGGRLLSTANPASPPGFSVLSEPLARGGSLVLVARPDEERLESAYLAERATARHQPARL